MEQWQHRTVIRDGVNLATRKAEVAHDGSLTPRAAAEALSTCGAAHPSESTGA